MGFQPQRCLLGRELDDGKATDPTFPCEPVRALVQGAHGRVFASQFLNGFAGVTQALGKDEVLLSAHIHSGEHITSAVHFSIDRDQ